MHMLLISLRTARVGLQSSVFRAQKYSTRRVQQKESIQSHSSNDSTQNTNESALLPGQFLIGTPHAISNIRPIKFHVPSDETASERTYRTLREAAAQRDHEFWQDNNTRFDRGRVEFERRTRASKGECTLDDLSAYFKQYQEESYARHLEYNRYVWRRSWQMVWPGIRAWAAEVGRRRRRRHEAVARHSEQGYFFDGQGGAKGGARDSAGNIGAKRGESRRDEKIRSYY